MATNAPHVYAAICAVMNDLAEEGISKARRNTQGSGYNFRGIDDVYNALSSALSKNSLVIIPRVLGRDCVERVSRSGGALFYTIVDVEFDIISSVDGTKHTARTVGEAMDSGDKSSNKAMSAAYKYMAFQTFCIPTEGENDADSQTHDVASNGKPSDDKPKPVSAAQQKRGLEEIERELLDCESVMAVGKCAEAWRFIAKRDGWSKDYLSLAGDKFNARKRALQDADAADIFPGDVPMNGSKIIQNHPIMAG